MPEFESPPIPAPDDDTNAANDSLAAQQEDLPTNNPSTLPEADAVASAQPLIGASGENMAAPKSPRQPITVDFGDGPKTYLAIGNQLYVCDANGRPEHYVGLLPAVGPPPGRKRRGPTFH